MSRWAKAVVLLGTFAVLFALVCPLAPTPRAVRGVKHMTPAPLLVTLPLAATLPSVISAPVTSGTDFHFLLVSNLRDLICTRVC